MWPSFQLEVIFTLVLAQPAVLSNEPLTLPLMSREDTALSTRVGEVARSPAQNVVLVLKGFEVEARPEISWEVYVEPDGATRDAQSPYLVGVVSLFDRASEPAEFLFVLDNAIAAAGRKDLQLRFVPISGVVVDGQPQATDIHSNVTIGEISLAVESADTNSRQ